MYVNVILHSSCWSGYRLMHLPSYIASHTGELIKCRRRDKHRHDLYLRSHGIDVDTRMDVDVRANIDARIDVDVKEDIDVISTAQSYK